MDRNYFCLFNFISITLTILSCTVRKYKNGKKSANIHQPLLEDNQDRDAVKSE